jgi:Tfp pilus assembly protein PilX
MRSPFTAGSHGFALLISLLTLLLTIGLLGSLRPSRE